MICIAIAPESHRLGIVDMHNAAPQCDLIEVRLDRLQKPPEIGLFLQTRRRPVLFSCRRKCDGGEWQGAEEARLAVLRRAIVAGPEYVELELDIADKVPRFGNTKRVVSFTHLDEWQRPPDLEDVYLRACRAGADFVKLTTPAATLDQAWPLLRVLARHTTDVPVVAVGLGRPGLTLSLLGCKAGSPWIYAALERGMEAHPGQATVAELEDVFCWREIGRDTRLIGVCGFEPRQLRTIRLMNAAFRHLGLNTRCLPMELGCLAKFGAMMDALRVNGLVLDAAHRGRILEALPQLDEAAQLSRQVDLALKQKDGWHGYNTIWRSAIKTLEQALAAKAAAAGAAGASPSQAAGRSPLEKRNVLILGASATARAIAYGVQRRGAAISVVAHDNDRAQLLAQMFQCRYVPLPRVYDTLSEIVIQTDESGEGEPIVGAGYFRSGMTAVDLGDLPEETRLLEEARICGCTIVEPRAIYLDQVAGQVKALTGKDVPLHVLEAALD